MTDTYGEARLKVYLYTVVGATTFWMPFVVAVLARVATLAAAVVAEVAK